MAKERLAVLFIRHLEVEGLCPRCNRWTGTNLDGCVDSPKKVPYSVELYCPRCNVEWKADVHVSVTQSRSRGKKVA